MERLIRNLAETIETFIYETVVSGVLKMADDYKILEKIRGQKNEEGE